MKPRFLLAALLAALWLPAQVKMTRLEGRIDVEIDGKPFTSFYHGSETSKPYLHPLRSASGKIVTRRYPMENVDGEARDHIHHTGLWFTHGDVNGYDFWANDPSQRGDRKGKVLLHKIDSVQSGAKQGSIAATFEWRDPQGKPLLTESRTMTFRSDPALRVIDLDIRLAAVERARFGDTKEGTFAIRLATELEEKHSGRMVNAGGKATEKGVWGARSPWVDYSGQLGGEKLGVAILDHPENPRHPTYWHSRAYGLFAANVFGERDFLRDKSRDGSMTLEPGQPWRFRYRVIIHPGGSEDIGLRFREYRQPLSN